MRFGPVVTDEHPSHHTSRSVVFFEPEATSSLLMVQCSKHVIPPVVQGRPHRLPGARSRRRAQHSAQNSADLPATRQPVSPAHRLRWSTPISVAAVQRLTASEFDRRNDLPDWRVLLGRIEANFVAPSFEEAAVLVGDIAAAAEAADHHPDLDLRYPGHVHVALSTHAAAGLTERDAALATTISALAERAGARSEPRASTAVEIAIDAIDIDAVRPFWQAVLAYDEEPPSTPGGPVVALVDPLRIGPAVWFQQMDVPRPQRNRIHIDITVAADAAEERMAAALAAGARLLTDQYARSFWVLADAEDNEACMCTWLDRD